MICFSVSFSFSDQFLAANATTGDGTKMVTILLYQERYVIEDPSLFLNC